MCLIPAEWHNNRRIITAAVMQQGARASNKRQRLGEKKAHLLGEREKVAGTGNLIHLQLHKSKVSMWQR